MFGIKIQDTKPSAGGTGILSFDLRDILAAIGEPVRLSQWRCHDLRYTAEKDGKFYEFRERLRRCNGQDMIEFAAGVHQTIDGRFSAKSSGAAKKPWLIILAVDSSWFEVWSTKPQVIARLAERFAKVSELSGSGSAQLNERHGT
jgi:hypothetical protein